MSQRFENKPHWLQAASSVVSGSGTEVLGGSSLLLWTSANPECPEALAGIKELLVTQKAVRGEINTLC